MQSLNNYVIAWVWAILTKPKITIFLTKYLNVYIYSNIMLEDEEF